MSFIICFESLSGIRRIGMHTNSSSSCFWGLLGYVLLDHVPLLRTLVKGIYGAYFSKLNYRWSRDVRSRTWLKTHPVLEVVLVSRKMNRSGGR